MRPAVYVLSTGTELSTGRSIDTNAPFIARMLAERGFAVAGLGTLPDDYDILKKEIIHILERPDVEVAVMTGGLGPTDDDLTVDVLAEIAGTEPVEDPDHLRKLEILAKRFSRRLTLESTRRQVRVVQGARTLRNERGLAPGMALEVNIGGRTKIVAAMPGVPQEMEQMMSTDLVPFLEERYPDSERGRAVFYVYNMGESEFQARFFGTGRDAGRLPVKPIFTPDALPEDFRWGITAGAGHLKVFFEARSARAIAEMVEDTVVPELPHQVCFAPVEDMLHEYCLAQNVTVAAAESCTGGLIGKILTDRPGSSGYFLGSLATYANAAKQKVLGVPESILVEHGAVSKECAVAMAEGVRRITGADYSVAVTGIAGPDGGSDAKPVGTVYIACAGKDGESIVDHLLIPLDRDRMRNYTARIALFDLYRYMRGTYVEVGRFRPPQS